MKKIFVFIIFLIFTLPYYRYITISDNNENQNIKVGLLSDIHIPSNTDAIEKALRIFKAKKVDLIIIAGDIINNTKLQYYDSFNIVYNKVYPFKNQAPKRLMVMGNHDWWITQKEKDENADKKFKEKFGYDSIHNTIVINGFHFIGISSLDGYVSLDGQVRGNYSGEVSEYLKTALNKALLQSADKPVFVIGHFPALNTVPRSDNAGSGNFEVNEILSGYPQAVYFSGHTHNSVFDERVIHQDKFTAICLPSIFYQSLITNFNTSPILEQNSININASTTGTYTATPMALYMEIDEEKIEFSKIYVANEGKTADVKWQIKYPVNVEEFKFTNERYYNSEAPYFEQNATAEVISAGVNTQIKFTAAKHNKFVFAYKYMISDNISGNIKATDYYTSDYHFGIENMSDTVLYTIKGLAQGNYNVKIYAMENFGKLSENFLELNLSVTT